MSVLKHTTGADFQLDCQWFDGSTDLPIDLTGYIIEASLQRDGVEYFRLSSARSEITKTDAANGLMSWTARKSRFTGLKAGSYSLIHYFTDGSGNISAIDEDIFSLVERV